jgi:ankyrin repeat protein
MRAAVIAMMLTFGSQAGAECGKLCDWKWWETATTADVQAELSGGADVMARSEDGVTPLHTAAQFGTPANIQALLAAGADVMARDKYGDTPLHEAGTPANIQALLAAGADAKAKDKSGKSPRDYA